MRGLRGNLPVGSSRLLPHVRANLTGSDRQWRVGRISACRGHLADSAPSIPDGALCHVPFWVGLLVVLQGRSATAIGKGI